MARRLVLAIVSTLVVLALGEALLRLVEHRLPAPSIYPGERENADGTNFIADAAIGWRLKPGRTFEWETEGRRVTYRADANGHRIANGDEVVDRDAPRLLVTGDSFAFGIGVDFSETFGAHVARELGLAIENVAMPGFGVDQIWRSLDGDVLSTPPVLVIVALYEYDFDRSHTAYRAIEGFNKPMFMIVDGELRRRAARDRPSAFTRWLERRSRIHAAVRAVAREWGRSHGSGQWWELNEKFLDAIRERCARANVPVLFVLIPPKWWKSFPAVSEYMSRVGADWFDPTTRHDRPPEGAYYENDLHLSAIGHRWLATSIVEWIRERRPDLFASLRDRARPR